MSPRFKSVVDIPESSYDDFLSDLNAALEEEKTFPGDDLSLYYLIDKKHFVGEDYVPKGLVKISQNSHYNVSRNDLSLRPDVEKALTVMADAALEDGIKLMVSSTYRSYEYQKNLFARYVREDGEELASRYSAKPGTSQHQLGVAIDFGSVTDDFALTKMGKWLNQHSEEYGWSLSFPQDYEDVTGFMWECWHFRYVGVPACRLQKNWFGDVQQFMIEFIDEWKKTE
ncbi:MAG: M15 family metallopeptidase [Treponema sp.]|nr:M15 family metallopeptidase [Treponema sp.]